MTFPASPTAAGTLAKMPIPHWLVYMLDHKLSGTTRFTAPTGQEHLVYVKEGRPAKVRLGAAVHPLDRILLDLRLADATTLATSLRAVAQSGALHGRYLVEHGALTQAQLDSALAQQLERKLAYLFEMPTESAFAYFDGVDELSDYGGPEALACEPLAVLLAGVRGGRHDLLARAVLGPLADQPLRLHPRSRPEAFGLSAEERRIISQIVAQAPSLMALIRSGVAPEPSVLRLGYALSVTRHLDTGSGKEPADLDPPAVTASSSRPPRPPPPAASRPANAASTPPAPARPLAAPPRSPTPPAATDDLGAELARRLAALPETNHYELLSVPRASERAAIESAYFALAKTFHPDRLSAGLAPLRSDAARLFARINEAYQALIDPATRAAYDAKLDAGNVKTPADDAAQVARVMSAALDFQKAEMLLRSNDLEGAERLARRAVTADPEQPEHVALLVWVQAEQRAMSGEHSSNEDLIAVLDKLLAKEQRFERAMFYRGMLYKRAGDAERAVADLRLAATINPRNLEAVREVNIYEMRHRKAAPSPSGGIFSKLFKKS